MKKQDIITGCSSFNESYWKGIFYPEDLPRSRYFEFYSKQFNTYEMNGTFYRFPTPKSLAAWYDKAPEGFLFSVKMYKGVTHFKKFADCEKEIAEFYSVCHENLKEKLACVLFQLPPSFAYSEERLAMIVNSLNPEFRNVIEFRHDSWWREDVYEILAKHQIIFCNVSYPKLPENLVSTNKTGYVRLHGVPKLFYSGYSEDYLKALHHNILDQDWKYAFVYFNNTASAEGILNALAFDAL